MSRMRRVRRPIGVLASGGLDSCALIGRLARAGRRVVPIYIAGGLRWETVERYWLCCVLRRLAAERLRVEPLVDLALPVNDLYGRHWSTGANTVPGAVSSDEAVYLPGRNLLLTVKAALYCAQHDLPQLAIGVLRGNPFTDSSERFFRQVSAAVQTAVGRRVSILRPLARRSKADVIRQGRSLPLHLSFSCLRPQGRRHCGRCNKCAERRRAFRAAGVPDRTIYKNGTGSHFSVKATREK